MSFQDEKIVENKKCQKCNIGFDITDKDLEFYEKVSPIFNDEKYSIPTPKLCPDCRFVRRMSFRNLHALYKRTCDATGKGIVSIYSPDKDFTIFNQDFWWSDGFNPLDYGTDFDFTQNFTQQFQKLMKKVPRIGILNGFSENSDYANHSYHNKNSYMTHASWYCEDSMYWTNVFQSNNIIDCLNVNDSENCYQVIDSKKCFNSSYITNSENCSFSKYIDDCINVEFCFGCKGLRNMKYNILNKQYSKDEYMEYLENIKNDKQAYKTFLEWYKNLSNKVASKDLKIQTSENIINSDYILNSSNLNNCFDCINSKDMKYCSEMIYLDVHDCYDYDIWGENTSFTYEVHCSWNTTNLLFSNVVWG